MKLLVATAAIAAALTMPALAESGDVGADNQSGQTLENQSSSSTRIQVQPGVRANARASETMGAQSKDTLENPIVPQPPGQKKNDEHDSAFGSGGSR